MILRIINKQDMSDIFSNKHFKQIREGITKQIRAGLDDELNPHIPFKIAVDRTDHTMAVEMFNLVLFSDKNGSQRFDYEYVGGIS